MALATATAALSASRVWAAPHQATQPKNLEGEILGQGEFRYRANRFWGVLDRELTHCIGCGGLSLQSCPLYNPGDEVARRGPGSTLLDPD